VAIDFLDGERAPERRFPVGDAPTARFPSRIAIFPSTIRGAICGSVAVLGCAPMLTGKQRRYLRSLGHHLSPVVHVGKDGVSEGLLTATDEALEQHELIKVKLGENAGSDRHALAAALAEGAGAELAGVLGRTALLYRARVKDPAIQLPPA
jgi:RNA-binding protein